MKTVLLYVRYALQMIAQLNNPIADAALAGVVVQMLPFVHVDTQTLVGVCLAVGIVATWMQKALAGLPAKVAQAKAAKAAKANVAP